MIWNRSLLFCLLGKQSYYWIWFLNYFFFPLLTGLKLFDKLLILFKWRRWVDNLLIRLRRFLTFWMFFAALLNLVVDFFLFLIALYIKYFRIFTWANLLDFVFICYLWHVKLFMYMKFFKTILQTKRYAKPIFLRTSLTSIFRFLLATSMAFFALWD